MKKLLIPVILMSSVMAKEPAIQDHSYHCIVVRQAGIFRNLSQDELTKPQYANHVEFPCSYDDYKALNYYLQRTYEEQEFECPGCFPRH